MSKSLDAIVLRYAGFGLLFLAVCIAIYLVRGALPIFVISGVVAFALEPVLQKLEKRGHSRRSAVGLVFGIYLLLSLVLLALLAAAFQQGQTLVANRATYSRQVAGIIEANREKIRHSKLPKGVRQSIDDGIDNSLERLQREAPGYASTAATWAVSSLGALCVSIFLLTLITVGLMLEAQPIRGRLLMLVPPPYRRDMSELSHSINELLGRYMRGQLIVCGTYGALCTVDFEILSRVYGMQYPLVLGAVAAAFYILPYIGLATIMGVSTLTAYLTASQPVSCAIAVFMSCIVFNLIVDYGVAPRVLGRGVGLHPLMVIFALLCGLQLAGPLGTVVAVPIFASLRLIAIYLFPQLAAPLPEESPHVTACNEPHSTVSEKNKRLAEAEAPTQSPGPTVEQRVAEAEGAV